MKSLTWAQILSKDQHIEEEAELLSLEVLVNLTQHGLVPAGMSSPANMERKILARPAITE